MPFNKQIVITEDDDDDDEDGTTAAAVPRAAKDEPGEAGGDDEGARRTDLLGEEGEPFEATGTKAAGGRGPPRDSSLDGVPIDAVVKHLELRTQSAQLSFDFLLYIGFLVMFIFFSQRDIDTNYYTVRVVQDRLLGNEIPTEEIDKFFPDMANANDWGRWASYVMVPNVWDCKYSDVSRSTLDMQGNMLLGSLRIRTLRVRNDSCSVNSELADPRHTPCYGGWESSREETVLRHYFPNPLHHPNHTVVVSDMDALEYRVDWPVTEAAAIASVDLLTPDELPVPAGWQAYCRGAGGGWAEHEGEVTACAELLVVLPEAAQVAYYKLQSAAESNMRTPTNWTVQTTTEAVGVPPAEDVTQALNWTVAETRELRSPADWEVGGSMGGTLVAAGNAPAVQGVLFTFHRMAYNDVADTPETPFLYRNIDCPHGFPVAWIYGDIDLYHCGGYVIDIPFSSTCRQAQDVTKALQSSNYPYYDVYATRLLIVELFLYTTNTNTFTSVKLFSEVAATGSWLNKWQIRTFEVYNNEKGKLIFNIFFFLFVLYFVFRFFDDWRQYHKGHSPGSYATRGKILGYLLEFWNLLEFGNLVCFIFVFCVEFLWMAESTKSGFHFPYHKGFPQELDYILNLYMLKVTSNAVNMIITFLKFLKYVRLNSRLNVLSATIAVKAGDLVACLIIFFYVVFAYALCANALFGATLFEYRSLGETFVTLMRMLLGDFDFEQLKQENLYLAALFFWSFVVVGLFLLLNFLVAILSEGFAHVSGEMSSTPLDEQFVRIWYSIKRALRPSRLWRGLRMWVQGNSFHVVLTRATIKIADYRAVMEEIRQQDDDDDAEPKKALVYKQELPAFIGEEYALLGDEFMDDLWDDVVYEHRKLLQTDAAQVAQENQDHIEEAVRLAAAGHLDEIDHTWHKLLQLNEELNNLAAVVCAPKI